MLSQFLNRITLASLCLTTTLTNMVIAQPISPPDWQATSLHTRQTLARMDELINQADKKNAYQHYMAMFHPDVQAWGLHANGAADISDIREHYKAVFFELGGGVLVSDKVVATGPMAAQRYHSLMSLSGTFDGVTASSKPVVIRGQTVFRIDREGRILERWSNHDHAYRMGQLLGERGTLDGREITRAMNGPGLSEPEALTLLSALIAALNQPESPVERQSDTANLLSSDFRLHGGSNRALKKARAMQSLENFWQAFPDVMVDVGTPITAWAYIAANWQATGSWRQEFMGALVDHAPVCIQGDMILRLSDQGQIDEAWLDAGAPTPGHCK